MPQKYFYLRYVGYPIGLLVFILSVIFKKPMIGNSFKERILKTDRNNQNNIIISMLYYYYLQNHYFKIGTCIFLLTLIIKTLSLVYFPSQLFRALAGLPLLYCVFLYFRIKIIATRIKNGSYGSNKDEAKNLVALSTGDPGCAPFRGGFSIFTRQTRCNNKPVELL